MSSPPPATSPLSLHDALPICVPNVADTFFAERRLTAITIEPDSSLLQLCRREARDSVTDNRTKPDLLSDLDSNSSEAERITVGVANNLLEFQRVRINLHDVRRCRSGGATLARSEKRTVGRPPDVVDAKPDRNDVFLDRRLAARQANERLVSPSTNVEPFTIFGYLDPIRTGCFAARYHPPPGTRMPFPQLAIVLARHHFGPSIGIPARQKIRRGEATVRQTYYGVQTYRLRRNSASNPG